MGQIFSRPVPTDYLESRVRLPITQAIRQLIKHLPSASETGTHGWEPAWLRRLWYTGAVCRPHTLPRTQDGGRAHEQGPDPHRPKFCSSLWADSSLLSPYRLSPAPGSPPACPGQDLRLPASAFQSSGGGASPLRSPHLTALAKAVSVCLDGPASGGPLTLGPHHAPRENQPRHMRLLRRRRWPPQWHPRGPRLQTGHQVSSMPQSVPVLQDCVQQRHTLSSDGQCQEAPSAHAS